VTEGGDHFRESGEPYRVGAGEQFQSQLLAWATPENLRDFPWRRSRDPYRLLFSELMLRRTQARQVVPVFDAFFARWPSLREFLEADAVEVAQILWPLGLQWRIQNLLDVQLALRAQGTIPVDYASLLELPGVGDYVASAVVVFSEAAARPLIDTNTVRVIGRYFGLPVHQGTRRLKSFQLFAGSLVPATPAAAAKYHYALLDLAATICKPALPVCEACPLAAECHTSRLKDLHI
jgi:A/G-specific adenine glycosylase